MFTQDNPLTMEKFTSLTEVNPRTEKVESLRSGGIFAQGISKITHPFHEATKVCDKNRQTSVKWVAVKINNTSWIIYHSLSSYFEHELFLNGSNHLDATYEQISKHGVKLTKIDEIKSFVPCDSEMLAHYSGVNYLG